MCFVFNFALQFNVMEVETTVFKMQSDVANEPTRL